MASGQGELECSKQEKRLSPATWRRENKGGGSRASRPYGITLLTMQKRNRTFISPDSFGIVLLVPYEVAMVSLFW